MCDDQSDSERGYSRVLRLVVAALYALLVLVSGTACRGGAAPCKAPDASLEVLTHEEHGYCLLYPAEYDTTRPNEGETVIYQESLLNVGAPRAYIEVEDAAGRRLNEIAEARLAEFPGFGVRRSETAIGGAAAVILEPVPGQDIGREVLMAHEGRLYHLLFVPLGPDDPPDVVEQAEELYTTVVGSWRFLPR